MSFHDIRFPTAISFGSTGGPERRTEVVTLASGREERNTPWSQSRRRYDAGLGVRTLDDLHAVIAFFEARMGRLHAFRWKDWIDCKSSAPSAPVTAGDQILGVGDGLRKDYTLIKNYISGSNSYTRFITRHVTGTLRIAAGGTEVTAGADYTVAAGGSIVFSTAPAPGAEVTAGFEFDVPVRLDTDALTINLASFELGEIPSIPIIEVRD